MSDQLNQELDDYYDKYINLKSKYEHLNTHSKNQAHDMDLFKQELAKAHIEAARLRKEVRLLRKSCETANKELNAIDEYLNKGNGTSIHCYSRGHQDIKTALDIVRGLYMDIAKLVTHPPHES